MSLNLKELFGGNRITKGLRGVYFDTPLCPFGYPSEGLAHEAQVSPVRNGRYQRDKVGQRIKEIDS
jgi:hypothetical protein